MTIEIPVAPIRNQPKLYFDCVRPEARKAGVCQTPQMTPRMIAAVKGEKRVKSRGNAKPRHPVSSPQGPGSIKMLAVVNKVSGADTRIAWMLMEWDTPLPNRARS